MPKMKTNRAAAKRFRKTASGKWRHTKANRRHMLTHKSPKRRRHLREAGTTTGGDANRLSRMLPGR